MRAYDLFITPCRVLYWLRKKIDEQSPRLVINASGALQSKAGVEAVQLSFDVKFSYFKVTMS